MGDHVQRELEGMVAELEDLEERGLFSRDEIRMIVKRRKESEYLLRRKAPRKDDYLEYIEYEQNLEKLRAQRKLRRGIKKPGLGDTGGKRRIHWIFERALRRFVGDLELWHAAIDYSLEVNANTVASKRLAEAVRLHPRHEEFWVKAAMFHFERSGDMSTARTLMQTGLRVNKQSPYLWSEYLRLEALHIFQLRTRRIVLGIDNKDGTPNEEAEEKEDPQERARLSVLFKGELLRIVYRNALKALKGSLDVRKMMVEALQPFADGIIGDMTQTIAEDIWVESISTESPYVDENIAPFCWEELARFRFAKEDSKGKADQVAMKTFQEGLEATNNSPVLGERYAIFLQARLEEEPNASGTSNNDSIAPSPQKKRRRTRKSSKDLDEEPDHEQLREELKNLLDQIQKDPAETMVNVIAKSFPNDEDVLEKCAELAPSSLEVGRLRLANLDPTEKSEGDRIVGEVLKAYAASGNLQGMEGRQSLLDFFLYYIQFYIETFTDMSTTSLIDLFLESASWMYTKTSHLDKNEAYEHVSTILQALLEWINHANNLAVLETVLKKIQATGVPPVLPISLYQKAIDLLQSNQCSQERIRGIYETASLAHPNDLKFWVEFIQFERNCGTLATEEKVLSRALKAGGFPKEKLLEIVSTL